MNCVIKKHSINLVRIFVALLISFFMLGCKKEQAHISISKAILGTWELRQSTDVTGRTSISKLATVVQ